MTDTESPPDEIMCENCLGEVTKSGDGYLCLSGCGHVGIKTKPSINKLRELFLKYGECEHPKKHYVHARVGNVLITDCGVCGERIDLEYIS